MARRKKNYRIAVADSETDPFDGVTIPEPFLWGYYDGETYQQFETTDEFMRLVFTIAEPTIIYAHNGGRFDWHFILDYLPDLSGITIINGRIAAFKIGEVEFRDSYNILPTALRNMQKDDFDYRLMHKSIRAQYMDQIAAYLKSDCLYLFEYVSGFIRQYGLHLTQAGAAMKYWETMNDGDIPNDAGGRLYDAFAKFYYGGRCEAIKTGVFSFPCTLVDINSAYPYAMLESHPYSLDYQEISKAQFKALPRSLAGSCFIELDAVCIGGFPFRLDTGELVFPRDTLERRYYVTGWEYLAAIETGVLKKEDIIRVYRFTELQHFKDYVTHFYQMRQEAKRVGDKQTDLYAKIFMNSLYGKFAANPRNYANYKVVDGEHIDVDGAIRGHDIEEIGDGWFFAGQLGSRFLASKRLDDEEMRFYNVATAASVTGYVRAMLWKAMCSCDTVLYCDTDSILAKSVGTLSLGNKLGEFKHECDFIKAGIAGKKLYVFETAPDPETGLPYFKTASKGARLTPEQLYQVAQGKTITYHPEAPTFSVHAPPQFVDRQIKMVKK